MVVDAATVWLDGSAGVAPQPRPSDLPEDLPLRVLGI